ncbi:MAG TPA: YidC/Oxa1 family membrane protein insertase [Baekduia sp.]|nr:YidC/Oxa1 family membrane protein insertase [Baekduia sp.]
MTPLANIFQPLVDLFEKVLVHIHSWTGVSWGAAIILLTILIRAALLPLAVKQFRSMRQLQIHAPELKKIQEKYKDDPQRRNQETMKFYQENKVNPFASCLPLLAQLPVFLSLFYMLRTDLRHDICPDINPAGISNPKPCGAGGDAAFWFIPDITDKATGGVLITLILLYVGSQLLSSLLMMTPTIDKTQRTVMLALPVVFVPFVIGFPAGLMLYWITTNFWTIGQQQFLKRVIGRNDPVPPPPDPDAEPSGWFGKFAAAAAQAGEAQKAAAPEQRVTKAPPPPPRQKKRKRSGRRK